MAYKYYCTYCGKELSQDSVLFDMQYLLTGSESITFNILKFRMTLAQLQQKLAQGTPGTDGHKVWSFSFAEIMSCIANENNLNDPRIAALTMEDIRGYLDSGLDLSVQEEEKAPVVRSIFDDEPEPEEEVKVTATVPKDELSGALLALEGKSTKIEDRALTKKTLSADLTVLRNVFSGEGAVYQFQIKLVDEKDNENRPVIYGYSAVNSQTGVANQCDKRVRVCPHCGGEVFQHAGTAKHQAIAFIGDQKAGKTSLILALTYYAMNGTMVDFGDEILKNTKLIDKIANIELLERNIESTMQKELDQYAEGIAPVKTASTKLAYNVTFRIRNRLENKKQYILTLTDLPGELCLRGGSVDTAKVINMFNVALSCDAYVLCFDSTTAVAGANAVGKIQDVCSWAEAFQKLRETHTNVKGYAPMMVAFTKSETVNAGGAAPTARIMDTVKDAYMFRNERAYLDRNAVFNFVGERLQQTGKMGTAYQSCLRCSPFGFAAPGSDAVEKDPTLNKREDGSLHKPEPFNVDQLMRWILMVSGCIPTEIEFHPELGAAAVKTFPENFVCRPQLREELPHGLSAKEKVREAACRCYLFENPGKVDREYLERCDEWAGLVALETRIKFGLKN